MKNAPTKKTIYQLDNKFKEQSSVLNRHIRNSKRKKTGRSGGNIAVLRNSVLESPKKFLRRQSKELNISVAVVHRILRSYLLRFLYRTQIKHALTKNEKGFQIEMCDCFNNKLEENNERIKNVWFFYKAHFWLNDVANSRNS